jgi:nucleoside-diphosphate-sugar epimerase
MVMKIFVAGASGTIGVPLVRELVRGGHQVTAMTRSREKRPMLESLGATAVIADALDADSVMRAVVSASPTHVIHQLTALPKDGSVRRARDLVATNRLRIEGTRHLLAASIAAGAKRIVAQSFAPLQGVPADDTGVDEAADAVRSLESQVLEASRSGRIEGVVLRYGLFYGPDNPATKSMIALARRRMLPVVRGDQSVLPVIHMDDAVSATIAALERPAKPAGQPLVNAIYEIVDDRPLSMTEIVKTLAEYAGARPPLAVPAWLPRLVAPYIARITSLRVPASNARARAELGWAPAYPTIRDGLSQTFRVAA